MKVSLFVSAIIVISILNINNLYSQTDYEPGYIINHNNDTLRGFIDYPKWEYSPKSISFRTATDSKGLVYFPSDIKCFSVENRKYQSAVVSVDESSVRGGNMSESPVPQLKTDTVFLQLLVDGIKSLYMLEDPNLNINFFIGENGSCTTLVFRRYIKTTLGVRNIIEDQKFKGQLIVYLQDYPSIQKRISNVLFNKKDLVHLFDDYYEYTKASILYQSKAPKLKPEFGIIGGISITRLKFTSSNDHISLVGFDYPNSVNATFGVFLNIPMPKNHGRLSIKNELLYTSYKFNGQYKDVDNTDANIYSTYNNSIGFSYIKLYNLLKFKVPLKKVFLFVNGGLSNGIAVSVTNYEKVVDHVYSLEYPKERKAIEFTTNWEKALVLGLGCSLGNFSFEARIEKSNGMSNAAYLRSKVARSFFIIQARF